MSPQDLFDFPADSNLADFDDIFGDQEKLNLASPSDSITPHAFREQQRQPDPTHVEGLESMDFPAQPNNDLSFTEPMPVPEDTFGDPALPQISNEDIQKFMQADPHLSSVPVDNWTQGHWTGHASPSPTPNFINPVLVQSQPIPAQPGDFLNLDIDTSLPYQAAHPPPVQAFPAPPFEMQFSTSTPPQDIAIPSIEPAKLDFNVLNYPAANHIPVSVEYAEDPRSYRPPERVDPDYVPSGNPILHKRGGKIRPPNDFYPQWKFHDWGFTGRAGNAPKFRYHKSGEWNNQLTFSKEELEFYLNETRGFLTMWIQPQPAQYTHRFAQGASTMKCRFKECLAKNRTILKGFWRVAFDERAKFDEPAESGTLYDPFHNAGYVHLYCLERHFDLLELCKNFIVKPDHRNLRFEERNPMKIQFGLADMFTTWRCSRENEMHKRRNAGYPEALKQPRDKKFKLWYRLTEQAIHIEGQSRKNCRKVRGGISLEKHVGDLKKYERLVEERLQKQKNVRAREKAEAAEEAAIEAQRRAFDRRWSSNSASPRESLSPDFTMVQQGAPLVQGRKRHSEQDFPQPQAKKTRQDEVQPVRQEEPSTKQIEFPSQNAQGSKRRRDLDETEQPRRESKRLKGGSLDRQLPTVGRVVHESMHRLRFSSAPPS